MTKGISNWDFRDVRGFLVQHGFQLHHIKGSHYYFRRYHDSKIYMTHVQHHGSRSIPEGTMGAIIKQSGIPKSEWINS